MDPLLITTQADLSGANQVASGIEAAMGRVVASQLRVKAETLALKDAYSTLGPSAAQGNASAVAAIAEHEAALVAAASALKAAKVAVDELNAGEERETGTLAANVSQRQAATASISLAEGRMLGSNRAAAAFLATTLQLGPALQAAFPVIGALALVEVLYHVGDAIKEGTEALVGWDKAAKQAYVEVEKANTRLIEQQVALKLGETELGTVGKEGAAKATAEVQKWSAQQKILQDEIATTGLALGRINTQIEELKARPVEEKAGMFGAISPMAAVEAAHIAPKPVEPVPIAATDNLESLIKTQEQLTREVEKYRGELLKIQQIHKPGAEALVPLAEARQAEQLGAAAIEARQKGDEAKIALAEATAKHLLDLGRTTATQEEFELGEDEQKKLDIRINALKQLDALKQKSPTYSTDAAAQAEVAKNEGEIAALQTQRQTIALQTADKVQKAETEAQLKAIDLQIDAADRGSREKIALTQREVDIATVAYNKQGSVYDAAVAKNIAATKEFEDERQRLLEESVRAAAEQATADEKTALIGIKAEQEHAAAQAELSRQRIAFQSTTGGVNARAIYNEQTEALAAATKKQIDLVNQEADTEIKTQEKIRDAHLAAASEDATAEQQQKDVDAAVSAADRIIEIQAQAQAQITTITDKAAKEREQLWQQEVKEEQKAIAEFVTQSTAAFNNFLITITTTKGRGNEFRFIAQEWQKTLFGMEKDFLSFILKTVENTNQFKAITAALQKVLGSVLGAIGLPGAGAAVGGGAGGAAQAATTTANTTAVGLNTAADTALTTALGLMNVAIDANTDALFVDAFTPKFQEGGVMDNTGWAILHAGERVLTPGERKEYEEGRAGGTVIAGGDGGGDTFNIHHHTHTSAMDGVDLERTLRRNQAKVSNQIMRSIKAGKLRAPR